MNRLDWVYGQTNTMRFLKCFGVLVFAFICGCAHGDKQMRFTKGTGDVGQFILQQSLKRGARPVSTNDLPSIKGDWKYSEDQFGVVLHLGRERFDEVLTFLKEAFGPPAQEPTETTDGGKVGWYAAKTSGVAIGFSYDKKRTDVTVLAPQPASEIYKRLPEVLERSQK